MKYTMTEAKHITLGQLGEECAVQYLQGKGMRILARNVRMRRGEIDIIAREGNTTVFVEVKALGESEDFFPEDHLDQRKIRALRSSCQEYLIANRYSEDTDWRIDLAAVEIHNETRRATVRYYENAVGE